MSLDKSEIRIGVAREIGCALDDALEAAQGEIKFFEGGASALVQAGKQIQALAKIVDEDLEKETGEIPDLAAATLVKKFITRAVAVVESGARTAENHRLVSEGKTRALQAAVGGIKKRIDVEQIRVDATRLEAARVLAGEAADGPKADRAVGAHPGGGIKAQRLAEELAAQEKPPPKKRRPKRGENHGRHAG